MFLPLPCPLSIALFEYLCVFLFSVSLSCIFCVPFLFSLVSLSSNRSWFEGCLVSDECGDTKRASLNNVSTEARVLNGGLPPNAQADFVTRVSER